MSYLTTMEDLTLLKEDQYFYIEELNDEYAKLLVTEDMFHQGMNEVLYAQRFPVAAQEGLIGTIYDFAVTVIRNVCRFVEKIINWFTGKLKSIVNFRLKTKKSNDQLYDKFISMWNGLNGPDKATTLGYFKALNIDYTPSYTHYQLMCKKFDETTTYINTVVDQYTTQDVALFGSQTEVKIYPDWLKGELLEMLRVTYNVRFEDGSFVYESPFKAMDSSTMGALGYETMDTVTLSHKAYCENVFRNLRIVTGLKERFVKYQRALEDKARELKRVNTKSDKNDFAAASKNLVSSIMLSTKLTSILTNIDEALDTRRGWIIRKAIEACTATIAGKKATT